MVPEAPDPPLLSSLLPQAAAVRARTIEAARTSHHFLFIESLLFRLSEEGRRLKGSPPLGSLCQRWTLSACTVQLVTFVWPSCKKDVNAPRVAGSQAWGENR